MLSHTFHGFTISFNDCFFTQPLVFTPMNTHVAFHLDSSRQHKHLQADVENEPFDKKRGVTAVSPSIFGHLSHRQGNVCVTHVVILYLARCLFFGALKFNFCHCLFVQRMSGRCAKLIPQPPCRAHPFLFQGSASPPKSLSRTGLCLLLWFLHPASKI